MKFILICLLGIAGSGLTVNSPSGELLDNRTNMNDYIDAKLPAVIKYILENGMDPMELLDIKEGFSAKPGLIEYHGELELTNGWFRNLRSLRRSGDASAEQNGNVLKISGNFAVDNIEFDYDYSAKIMNIGPKGGVEGKVKSISFFCEIHKNTDRNLLRLKDFYLYNVGSISVKFTGNILIDWLTNAMVGVVTTLFKDVIVFFVEKSLQKAIEEYIAEYNFANSKPPQLQMFNFSHKQLSGL